jgi:50S ribosomal protein L16 3-hydroxylase
LFYDEKHIFIKGERYVAGGREARLMRKLAHTRALSRADLAKASDDALELLSSWFDAGWVRGGPLS